jgi:xanthine dehydrogenase accessory factor
MSDPTQILNAVVREVDAKRQAALCVVAATRGSTPQRPGAMLCVDEAGQATGTVGGGAVEAMIRRRACELLPGGRGGLFTFDLESDLGPDDGPICGGQMDVAVSIISREVEASAIRETIANVRAGEATMLPIRIEGPGGPVEYRVLVEASPKLLIAGAGHVGRAVALAMVPLGFRVSVIDDRSEFASAQRLPPPIEPVVGDIAKTLSRWEIDANTYVVIVTRGHQHDERALTAVLDSSAKYLGMIGSARKIEVVFDHLRSQGAAQEQLDFVHSPIGLDINAVTPEEIAVSIAAELVAVRRAGGRCRPVAGPFPVSDDAT